MADFRVCLVAGARPNFVKIAPLYAAFTKAGVEVALMHTGQHFDENMVSAWKELGLPDPDIKIETAGLDRGARFSEVMLATMTVAHGFDAFVVVGDVDSTLAAATGARYANKPVFHVEAGLRSRDERMAEEWNRIAVDHLSDLLFVTEEAGMDNLGREGLSGKSHFVGNVMIDSLAKLIDGDAVHDRPMIPTGPYVLMTLHRPQLVDTPDFALLAPFIQKIAQKAEVIWPMHPRTRARTHVFENIANLTLVEPMSYLLFVRYMIHAKMVITDSGGVQEETTWLGVPCLTFRKSTERPATISIGTNRVTGENPNSLMTCFEQEWGKARPHEIERPPLWDGKAADRIVEASLKWLQQNRKVKTQ